MNTEGLPTLLFVEDEPDAAAIAVEVLSSDYRVTHVKTGEEALRLALRSPFDLMLFDRRLPGISGTELVSKVRRAGLQTPILLLTALGSVSDRVEGLDGGANDYLVKPFDFEELKARLRALLRGYRTQTGRRDIAEWTFVPQNSSLVGPYGELVDLTETEARLLETLSSSPGHVFSRQELLSACFPPGSSPATVDSYIHYIRKKTEPDLIRTVRSRGYQVGGQG